MSDVSPISRRDALIAATALGTVVSVAQANDDDKPFGAGDPGDPRAGQNPTTMKRKPLKIQITLTDGQTMTVNATSAVIEFDDGGKIIAKPSGILPLVSSPAGEQQGNQSSAPPYNPKGNTFSPKSDSFGSP
jgi:hypothetical protein